MAEVEPEDILVVNKKRRSSEFAGSGTAVQSILRNLGSIHNIHLARLSDTKRFLLLEGDDIGILKRLQNTILPDAKYPIDSIPGSSIGGWAGWEKAIGVAGLLHDADSDIVCYCILDRDYRTKLSIGKRRKSAEANHIELHVWDKKEIENYLLVPTAIARLISKNIRNKVGPSEVQVEGQLDVVLESHRSDVFNALASELYQEDKEHGLTGVNRKAHKFLEDNWSISKRDLACGKQVLSDLSAWSDAEYQVSFSVLALARELFRNEIDSEVVEALKAIEDGEVLGSK